MTAPPSAYSPPPRPIPRQRPRRAWWRGCCLALVFLLFSGMMFTSGGVVFYAVAPPPTTNILILGSDARPGTADAQIARTDSMMVLSINPRAQRVSLFSVPRDVFIESPQYGWLRANTVLRNAELARPGSGPNAMMAAMEHTFNIQVHDYVRVSFEAFVEVVDAVGGVTVEVPRRIVDNTYPTDDYGTMRIEFEPGEQMLDGERALIYARTRHGDDDYQRAARQQQIVEALLRQLINPLHVPEVLLALNDNIDTSLNPLEMIGHAPGILLYGNSPSRIDQLVIQREHLMSHSSGGAVPNMQALNPWLDAHLR